MYSRGYVFTRIGKGVMQQTRSVRIDLSKWAPTSENRRVLKKTENLALQSTGVPISDYDWALGKLAKDFYEEKFGPGIMSAAKVKEMLTDAHKSNFNLLLEYGADKSAKKTGWTISYENEDLLHYSYPFYDLTAAPKDTGLGMMIRAIQYAKDAGMKYIYLGSLQRPGDTYKLQFEGLEWFDGGPTGSNAWKTDVSPLKDLLKAA